MILRKYQNILYTVAVGMLSLSFLDFSRIVNISGFNFDSIEKSVFRLISFTIIVVLIKMNAVYVTIYSRSTALYTFYVSACVISFSISVIYNAMLSTIMLGKLLELFICIPLIILFSWRSEQTSAKTLFWMMVIPIFMMLTIITINSDFGYSYTQSGHYRLGGAIIHPNTLAAAAAIGLLIVFSFAINGTLKILIVFLFFLIILLTQSRSVTIALLFAIFASMLLTKIDARQKLIASMVAVSVIMVVVILGNSVSRTLPGRSLEDIDTLTGRTQIWTDVVRLLSAEDVITFLFGRGAVFDKTVFIGNEYGFQTHGVHNVWLHVLTWSGFIPLILYILLYVQASRVRAETQQSRFSFRALWYFLLIEGAVANQTAIYLNVETVAFAFLLGRAVVKQRARKCASEGLTAGHPTSISNLMRVHWLRNRAS